MDDKTETDQPNTPLPDGNDNAKAEGVAKVIEAFGGIRPMANKLGIPVSTVQGWKERNVIPASRHEAVLEAARQHDIAITAADLDGTEEEGEETIEAAGEDTPAADDAPSPASEARPQPWAQTPEATSDSQDTADTPPEAVTGGTGTDEAEPSEDAKPRRGGGWLWTLLVVVLIVVGLGVAAALTQPSWRPGAEAWLAKQGWSMPGWVDRVLGPMPQETADAKPADDKAAAKPADDKPTAKPADDKTADKPADDKTADKPADDKTADKPADDKTADKPADDKAADKPADDKAADKPADDKAASDQPAATPPATAPVDSALAARTEALGSEMTRMAGQLKDIQAALADLAADRTPAASPDQIAALKDSVTALEKSVRQRNSQTESDLTRIGNQVQSLTGGLETVTQRLAALEKTNREALARLRKGEALLLAVSQTREALRDGRPFTTQIQTLTPFTGDPVVADAIAQLKPWAAEGIPTEATLVRTFPALADQLLHDPAPAEGAPDMVDSMLDEVGSLVTIRRIDDTDAQTLAGTVGAARAHLNQGDLSGAVTALETLPDPRLRQAQDWIAKARARLMANRELSTLDAHALAILTGAGNAHGAASGDDHGAPAEDSHGATDSAHDYAAPADTHGDADDHGHAAPAH